MYEQKFSSFSNTYISTLGEENIFGRKFLRIYFDVLYPENIRFCGTYFHDEYSETDSADFNFADLTLIHTKAFEATERIHEAPKDGFEVAHNY